MSGLLRRLTRRRPATADEPGPSTPEAPEPAAAATPNPAEPGAGTPVPAGDDAPGSTPTDQPTATGAEAATQVIPPTGDAAAVQPEALAAAHTLAPTPPATAPLSRDLPAGVDPGELNLAPAPSAKRGRLRKRLRYLRRVRELLLRDLGGFTYELHRTAGGDVADKQRGLAEAKATRLSRLDAEVRDLEARLSEPHAEPILREPGIGGACPECGELFASDAHYCFRCGAPLDEKARAARQATIAVAPAAAQPTPEPGPASVLWAGGPRPETSAAKEPPVEQPEPSPATSEWLLPDAPKPDTPAAERPDPAAGALFAPRTGAGDAGSEPAAGDETAETSDASAGDRETAEPRDASSGGGDKSAEPSDASAGAGDETAEPPATSAADDDETAEPPAASAADDDETAEPPATSAAAEDETAEPPAASAAAEDETAEAGDAAPRSRRRKSDSSASQADAERNGRREDDVLPPVTSGDPLAPETERRK